MNLQLEDKTERGRVNPEKVLVTGSAGFIGFHEAKRLLDDGKQVLGLDNWNEYYDVNLRRARLRRLVERPGFRFAFSDITDRQRMEQIFRTERFDSVIHLAAQAGVRYSLSCPAPSASLTVSPCSTKDRFSRSERRRRSGRVNIPVSGSFWIACRIARPRSIR